MSEQKEQEDNLPRQEPPSHWKVLSDVLAFQFKLLLDGLRDVLLSPISIGAAILGLISSPSDPGRYFYRLRKFGHKTDRWINLFNTYDDETDEPNQAVSADHFVRRAEEIVLNEYRKGGAVEDIKRHADGVLGRIQNAAEQKSDRSGSDKSGEDRSQ